MFTVYIYILRLEKRMKKKKNKNHNKKRKLPNFNSLTDIIYFLTKMRCNFVDLDFSQKHKVFSFVECNSIGFKILQYRGFDVLKNCFFVNEWVKDESTHILEIKRVEFDAFDKYFEYARGDIFDDACYLGYNFSDDELMKVGDKKQILNLNSYSQDVIENYTFEQVKILSTETNNKTKLPANYSFTSYNVLKWYEEGKFYIKQCWFDDNEFEIAKKIHCFDYFCDFYYFIHGDLSNADMIMCDGIENIKNLPNTSINGIKVRSDVAQKLGLKTNKINLTKKYSKSSFPQSKRYEYQTICKYFEKRPNTYNFDNNDLEVSYITDIHLNHKVMANKCKTREDCIYVMRNMVKSFREQCSRINLIGGDITSDKSIYEEYINLFSKKVGGKTFITLGNHELWEFEGEAFENIVSYYKKILSQNDMYLVQNNLFLQTPSGIKEITEKQLIDISQNDLRSATRDASLIIFGGIGLAGKNSEFNANNGIYKKVLNRQQEIELSNNFDKLYQKVANTLSDKNVIILTHMPIQDWSSSQNTVNGFVYVSGHNHRNFDDGLQRIYADNQIGYNLKDASLKHFTLKRNYDWFSDYKNGIYEISKNDYECFYRGICESMTFNRKFQKIYMLKNNNTYMFLLTTVKGTLMVLSGGLIKKAGNHSLEYFYNNLGNYSKSIKLYLSKYDAFQKTISEDVKKLGGIGTIHGCIVDIDFFNHLFINPLDGQITPYFAYSMKEKYIYNNIPSLLFHQCPQMYENYVKSIESKDSNTLIESNINAPISSQAVFIENTEMYRISKIIKALQFTTKYNIVRVWNDMLLDKVSEENGCALINNIISPAYVPLVEN